jgi:hypothetical protein
MKRIQTKHDASTDPYRRLRSRIDVHTYQSLQHRSTPGKRQALEKNTFSAIALLALMFPGKRFKALLSMFSCPRYIFNYTKRQGNCLASLILLHGAPLGEQEQASKLPELDERHR